jgi:hypothetical protein
MNKEIAMKLLISVTLLLISTTVFATARPVGTLGSVDAVTIGGVTVSRPADLVCLSFYSVNNTYTRAENVSVLATAYQVPANKTFKGQYGLYYNDGTSGANGTIILYSCDAAAASQDAAANGTTCVAVSPTFVHPSAYNTGYGFNMVGFNVSATKYPSSAMNDTGATKYKRLYVCGYVE